MFDIAFTEMLIIAVAALIVLGPERLPKVARQAGQWLGKLRRYVEDVKSDINRQMELQELRNLQAEVQQAARNVESSVTTSLREAQSDFDSVQRALDVGSSADAGEGTSSASPGAVTDWDRVYATRRARDRIRERRRERDQELGRKRPKRPLR